MPQAGEPGTEVLGLGGALAVATPSQDWVVDVPPGTNELRVALNGVDDGIANFDLYVKAGQAAGPTDYDCRAAGTGQFGYCAFDFPAPGPWHLLAQRRAGSGEYQLTATLIGGQPPVCGNAARETGEECDGSDDLACPGACEPSCRCANTCAEGEMVTQRARLQRHFLLRTLLHNDGSYDGLDPRTTDLGLQVEGSGPLAVDLTIPAGDPGWSASLPERGLFRWHGPVSGATHVRLRCRRTPLGDWQIWLSGRAARQG
jgi:hypothetical protein